jgi:anti-sigma factor (TIGR02949 family)
MKMTCEEVDRTIPWFLDDELEADLALEVEAHLGECEHCRAALEREGSLRTTLRRAATQVTAPAALRRSVRESIEAERRRERPLYRTWPAAAAAAILVIFIWKGAAGSTVSDLDVVMRVPDLPMDVVSGEVATVQDYLNHRLPFAVRLPRIAEGAVSSLGGRIMQVRDREAAYVRYTTSRGPVSVFVYEDPDDDFSSEVAPLYRVGNQRMLVTEQRGYTFARWRSGGLTYTMVTPLPAREFPALIHAGL